jgi:diadenosine tetraphosphate (Ap4A) HIT family hydrolase
VASNETAFAVRDILPVSRGHTLVITKRPAPTWWDTSAAERADVFDLVDVVKAQLDTEFAPDAYNVGFNAGAAAGQTIFHVHIHVIPRYAGDARWPGAGIRHSVPHPGSHLAP